MEIPVVTSEICGIQELVDNGHNGILTVQKDPDSIANAIGKLCMSDSGIKSEGLEEKNL